MGSTFQVASILAFFKQITEDYSDKRQRYRMYFCKKDGHYLEIGAYQAMFYLIKRVIHIDTSGIYNFFSLLKCEFVNEFL
jgi:hypothetical protein